MRFCIVCKSVIDADRAEAMPETRLCSEHGRMIEDYGGEFLVSVAQERTSKQGSLKINYGGVSTSRTRNHEALDKLRDAYEQQQFEDRT